MKRKAAVALVLLLSSLSVPVLAQNEAVEQCPVLPSLNEGAVAPLTEEPNPMPELDVFIPEPEARGCFTDCMNDWMATMCVGYTGPELQQCANDGAEGCRCYCGMWCN